MNNEISGKTLLSVTASIAATIIPDTPIVSIAGATLSEITTTTTSTTTTPTPTPTPTAFLPSIRANKDHGDITNLPKNPMSDAAVNKSAGGNGNAAASQTTTAINASAAADGASIAGKNSSIDYAPIENTTVNAGKTDDAPTNTTTTTDTKISDVSDLEEPELKKLLDEAYSYKAPKDKKDKSEIFLDLLQKVENEDLGIISTRSESHRHHPHSQSRHQQKQGGSLQDLLQLPSDYRRQNHTSRHKKNSSVSSRQREGGSLPSNVNVANCLLSSFGQQTNVYTDKRVRRGIFPGVDTALNSNKTLVGVVGLSVGDPNANCLLSTIEQHTDKPARRVVGLAGGDPTTASGVAAGTVAGGSGGLNSVSLCSEESGSGGVGTSVTTVSGGAGSMATTASGHNVGGTMATGTGLGNSGVKSVNSIGGSSDYIINIGDMIDIQQQQQILPSKTQDYGQILSYYDRVDIDLHIPHRSIRGDFVPARSHHYVDEVIRFPQIDGGADGSLCESGEVAISVNNLGNTLKSAAASCSLPMPLDERYRSIKSVMGEKGDVAGVGASLNAGVAGGKTSGATVIPNAGSISSVNASNNAGGVGVGVGSNGIGIGGYAKALPMSRQTDENGNDCERQQHASIVVSSTGQSQAKAKAKKKPQKDNTIPVDVVNEAGYRGKDPVEVLVKFIESTEEDGKQGGGSGNSKVAENSKKKERKKEKVKQSKMKKSNSLEELRSCAKIDVGELKRSAVTTESNNVTMRSKGSGGSKGGKNNSSSTADINKNIDGGSGKEINPTPAIPTAGGGGGGKQAAAIVNATSNHRKGERRSWGTEELQYLGNEGGNNVINVIGNVEAERTRDKKEKRGKDKDKDKDRERDVEREKDKGKDRETDKHDKLPNTKSDGGNTKYEKYDKYEKLEKTDKSDKGEKAEKTDKSEKRKKSETIMQTPTANAHESQSVERANTPVISAIELLSMNTLISETAEFHVVTKKKKPKKQRASIDETHFAHNSYNSNSVTTGGFSRGTHSAPAYAQKGGSNNNNYTNNNNNNNNNNVLQQQQQQQQSRYNKYHNNNAHGFNSYGNGGEDGRLDYRNNYNSNYNNYNSNHTHQNQQYGYQQQQQGQYHHHQHHLQHQQHQQQSHPVANAHNTSGGASSDKSRRKSTSSVPPSEKSDSSDLDSVHSLPIESTAASVTKSKPRHKTPVTSTTTSATSSPETPKSVSSGGSPGSAPISYAHIAASAAAERWPSLDVANNNSTNAAINGTINAAEQPQQQHMTNIEAAVSPPASTQSNSNNNSPTAVAVTAAATPNSASKQSKSKKAATKTDFPELIATSTSTTTTTVVGVPSVDLAKANATPSAATAVTGAAKTISYSQSLAATTAHQIPVANANNGVINEKLSGPSAAEAVVIPVNAQPAGNYTVPDVNKVDTMSGSTARVPQHQPLMQQQQLQQQTLQKSKSVEHESYNYNSSNLDQQYPALEQTVKRHSATNVSISPPTGIATGINSTLISGSSLTANAPLPAANAASSNKFNFAAAAKQQVSKNVAGSPQGIITQEPHVPAQALHQPQFNASTTSGTPAVPAPASNAGTVPTAAGQVTMPARKSKEKSPTAVYAPAPVAVANNSSAQIAIGNVAPQTSEAGNVVKKNKKEKTYSPLAPDTLPLLTAVVEPHTVHVAQKSSTATQTQATSMDLAGSGSGSGKNTRTQPTLVAKSEAVILPPATAASKPQRQHAGKNNAVATASQTATHNASTTAAATGGTVGASSGIAPTTNRPAVIILNDDRSGDNSALGIEFTFGDFNEDELKFFDDNIAEEECAEDFNAEVVEPTPEQQSLQGKATVELIGSADISTNTTLRASKVEVPEEMLNEQKVKPSFVDVRATSPKPAPFNQAPVTAVARKEGSNKIKNIFATENVNTRPADKVYALLTSQISSDSNKEGGYAATVTVQPDVEQSQQHELPRRNSETLQLQQLETCNDIETVIIAAARRAAEQQQQLPQPMQPPPSQHQRSYRHKHQQQQYRSTSYGNAYEQAPQPQREQRSQSAYNRDAPNHYQSHHYHNQYHQQTQQQQQQQHYHYHQSGSSNSGASRSRSSSSNNNTNSYDASSNTPPPQSPIPSPAVMVNMQRKELDIHFIPPIVSNAYSAMQHNEIIVDFIGSAWEEVSKVTKFYEGQ